MQGYAPLPIFPGFNFPIQDALDQNAMGAENDYFALLRKMSAMPSIQMPQEPQMQFDPRQMLIGGAVSALFGGADGANQFLQGNMQGAAHRHQQAQLEQQRQLQMQKLAQDREMGMLKTEAEIANAKANRAFQRAGQFRADVTSQRNYDRQIAKDREQTLNQYEAGYRASNSPDEKRHYARMLAGTPRAISAQELQAGIRSTAQPRIDAWKREVVRWRNTFDLNKEDRQMLEDERASIFRDFPDAGLTEKDIPGVPASESIRKQKMDEQKRQFEERLKDTRKRFEETLKMNKWRRETVFPQQMDARWASIEVARQNSITQGRNSDFNGARFELQKFESLGGALISDIQKKIDNLLIERAGQASLVKQTGNTVKMDDPAVKKIKEIDGKISYLYGLLQEQNQSRLESGLNPMEFPDFATRKAEVESALRGNIGTRPSALLNPNQTKKRDTNKSRPGKPVTVSPPSNKAADLRKKYGY